MINNQDKQGLLCRITHSDFCKGNDSTRAASCFVKPSYLYQIKQLISKSHLLSEFSGVKNNRVIIRLNSSKIFAKQNHVFNGFKLKTSLFVYNVTFLAIQIKPKAYYNNILLLPGNNMDLE